MIAECVAQLLKDNQNALNSYNPDSPEGKAKAKAYTTMVSLGTPIAEWWGARNLTVGDVNKANCEAYTSWRTSQYVKRHPNAKKPPRLVMRSTARADLKLMNAAIVHFKANYDPSLVEPTVTLPDPTPTKTDYWLTRDEVARRLRIARADPNLRHMARVILIGVYQGNRTVSATLPLRWVPSSTAGWFDLETEVLHRSGTGERQTKKRKPPCRINERLLPFLRRWRDADLKKGLTHVIHYKGGPIETSVKTAWHTLMGDNEDGVHILRHTCCTWLMRDGVDLGKAASYVGMTIKTLWDTYGHHHPDFHRDAARMSGKGQKVGSKVSQNRRMG